MWTSDISFIFCAREVVRVVSPRVYSHGVTAKEEEDFWITIRAFDRNLYGKKMDGTFGIKKVRESRASSSYGCVCYKMRLHRVILISRFSCRRSRPPSWILLGSRFVYDSARLWTFTSSVPVRQCSGCAPSNGLFSFPTTNEKVYIVSIIYKLWFLIFWTLKSSWNVMSSFRNCSENVPT